MFDKYKIEIGVEHNDGGGYVSNSAWDPEGIYDSYEYFSSHKTLTNGAIQKDKSETLMEFSAYRKDDTFTLKYRIIKSGNSEYTQPKTYNMVQGSLTEISVETVYEILVLHSIISEDKILKEIEETTNNKNVEITT